MIENIMINLAKLYEFFDTTDVVLETDIMDVLEFIANHNGTIKYQGELWDFKI